MGAEQADHLLGVFGAFSHFGESRPQQQLLSQAAREVNGFAKGAHRWLHFHARKTYVGIAKLYREEPQIRCMSGEDSTKGSRGHLGSKKSMSVAFVESAVTPLGTIKP